MIALLAYHKRMDPEVLMNMDPMFLDLWFEFFEQEIEAYEKKKAR